jgi:tetratricopeptide (TPR) repeat protein
MTTSLDDAWAHHRAGRLDEAAAVYADLLRADPERADVLHLLGNVEYQRGHAEPAERLIQRAIAIDPDSSVYRISLGHVYRRAGRLAEAEGCYRAAWVRSPDSLLAAMSLAQVLTGRDEPEQAAQVLQRVLAQQPQHLEALNRLGDLWLQLERPADAAEAYDRSLAIEPGAAEIHFRRGVAASQQGDERTAVESFHAALQRRPEFAEACYNLGVIDAEGQNLAAAEAWFRRALRIEPAYVDAQINLSAVLLKAGRAAEARVQRDQAYARQCLFVRRSRSARRTVLLLFDAGRGNINLSHLFSRSHNNLIDWMIEYAPEGQVPPAFDLVFNAMGDPGMTGATSLPVARFLAGCRKPLLNRPEAVARTARDQASELFAGIDGLHVPRTWRVEKQADWDSVGTDALPLLVRPFDSHGGAGLHLLRTAEELEAAKAAVAPPLYATAFCDFRSADGFYRKYRIIFIDRRPLPYHLAISPQWMVHYATAGMPGAGWKIDEERRFLDDPAGVLGERAHAAVQAIGRRLDLDYAGMDFSLLPDGRVLLFEANPVMLVHPEPAGSELAHKNPHVARIFDAFEALLARTMAQAAGG